MRCKVHTVDHTSLVGVCASCLRHRLCTVLAAQIQADARGHTLHFPHFMSPFYIPPRKSHTAPQGDRHCHVSNDHALPGHKFFSTPQIGPRGMFVDDQCEKKKKSKFSVLSNLFKFRTGKRSSGAKEGLDYEKTSRTDVFVEHYKFGRNKYSSEVWKQMPKAGETGGKRGRGKTSNLGRNVSGMALVSASPNGHWGTTKGCIVSDIVVPGKISVPEIMPRHSVPSPFCRNGSRKLADFGRHTRIH